MTTNPTGDSPSIFRDGRLRPGIYKIQNVLTETYVDIEMHSQIVCSRPANSLEEGRGLVRSHPSTVVYISDVSKWEIKGLGAGYSVRRVRISMLFDPIFAIVR